MLAELLATLGVPAKVAAAAVAATVAVGGLGMAGAAVADGGDDPMVVTTDTTDTSTTVDGTETENQTNTTETTDGTDATTMIEEEAPPVPDVEIVEEPALETDEPSEGQGPPEGTFGARVSADARDGGVDGPTIAAEARARNAERKAEAETEGGKPTGDGAETDGSSDAVVPGPPAHAGRPGGR